MSDVLLARVNEDSGFVIYHRVIGPDATDDDEDLVVPADVSTIVAKSIKLSDGSTVNTYQLTPVATYIKDPPITIGGVAYNFKWAVPAAAIPDGSQVYRIEIYVTPASGEPYYLRHVQIETIPATGS